MSHPKNESSVTTSASETVPLFHGELPNRPWYRAEPWLVPCLLAFAALALAILLGRPMLNALLGLAGLLLVSSVVLLLRQHARSRASADRAAPRTER